jgi:hypothetical protein
MPAGQARTLAQVKSCCYDVTSGKRFTPMGTSKTLSLKNQALIANAGIAAALVYEFVRGIPIVPVLIVGVPFFALVNLFYFIRMQRARKIP